MSVRWFVNRNFGGKITAVYKTSWNGKQLTSELAWSKSKSDWMPTEAVLNWYFNGDISIEEITEAEAVKQLPKKAF